MTQDSDQRVHAIVWSVGALVLAACLAGGGLSARPEPVPLAALTTGLLIALVFTVQTWRGKITWTAM